MTSYDDNNYMIAWDYVDLSGRKNEKAVEVGPWPDRTVQEILSHNGMLRPSVRRPRRRGAGPNTCQYGSQPNVLRGARQRNPGGIRQNKCLARHGYTTARGNVPRLPALQGIHIVEPLGRLKGRLKASHGRARGQR